MTRVENTFFGRMQTQSVCPSCGGTGKTITAKCDKCGGEGVVRGEEIVEIKIPAGVGDGMVVTVSGKGNAARHGGVNGDLLVMIEEERNPELVRDGNDLIHNLNIPVTTSILGGEGRGSHHRRPCQDQDCSGYSCGQGAASCAARVCPT